MDCNFFCMLPESDHRCCSGAEHIDRPLHFSANSLLKSRLKECATGTICLCFGLFALIHSLYLAAEFPSCGGRQVFAGAWESCWGRWHHVPKPLGPGRVPQAASITMEHARVLTGPTVSVPAPVVPRWSKRHFVAVWSRLLPLKHL